MTDSIHNDQKLTSELALRVMHWQPGPDRFLKSGRRWIPRWRFQPFEDIADAFQLLNSATGAFSLTGDGCGGFTAEVEIRGHRGKASGQKLARAMTTAVARAVGVEA